MTSISYCKESSFTIDRAMSSSVASDSDWQELGLRASYLEQEEIDYFYYVRNVETGEIILVDGEPVLLT